MSEFTPIASDDELDEVMTRPRPVLVEFMHIIQCPLIILGAGGKMGPTLALLARRAADAAGKQLDILAVSRYQNAESRRWLEERGIRTLSLDLLEQSSYRELPDTENLLYLVGLKFGTMDNPAVTWATNTLAPVFTCERYPHARFAALSTGNVYPLTSVHGTGSAETDPLEPLGEYSNACVARERIFDYYSQKNGTAIALLRLSYAVDLRYGVLFDIGSRVYRGDTIDLSSGYYNCIWQGDANEMIIRSLGLASSRGYPLNLTGPTWYTVRETARQFAAIFNKPVHFSGEETESAFLSNTRRLLSALGEPPTPLDWMVRWTAGWIESGGRSLNKPTHFETRDGKY